MDHLDVASEFGELRRDLHATHQRAQRAVNRIALLEELNYDVGEEEVRLRYLLADILETRSFMTDARQRIKKGAVLGEKVRDLFYDVAEDVELAKATLEDIRLPKLRSI